MASANVTTYYACADDETKMAASLLEERLLGTGINKDNTSPLSVNKSRFSRGGK